MQADVSELFDPDVWREVPGFGGLTDITYHHDVSGRIARVAFNRPEVRNAFRPHTVDEPSDRCGAVDGQWAESERRWMGLLLGRRSTHPRARRVQVRRRRDRVEYR